SAAMTLESFRKDVSERLDVVVKSADPQVSVSFSSCLSAEERKYIHHIAERFGLKHESTGRGDARFIWVTKDPAKAARRGLGTGAGQEWPQLRWPDAVWEALNHPLVQLTAEDGNAQAAAASAPLRAVSPRTVAALGPKPPPKPAGGWTPSVPQSELLETRRQLPAWQSRPMLLQAIQERQVTLVVGETGCGKSTQLPQFILEAFEDANIVVTQPRRISALSLAHRVAQERGEEVGDRVGYSVHLDQMSSRRCRLLFCTAGVFRRRLLGDPQLAAVTHLVMDELHERDKAGAERRESRLR
ncbi:unnamed protein product, partial [Effrenium voratum]